MAYSSRSRSASVRMEPFTRATGFADPVWGASAAGVCEAGACVNTVGGWDATWECDKAGMRTSSAQLENLNFMVDLRTIREKGGEGKLPLPFSCKGLRTPSGWCRHHSFR